MVNKVITVIAFSCFLFEQFLNERANPPAMLGRIV